MLSDLEVNAAPLLPSLVAARGLQDDGQMVKTCPRLMVVFAGSIS